MKLLHVFGAEPDAEVLERAARVARGLPRELKHFVDDAANLPAFDVPGAAALSEPLPLDGKVSLPRFTRIAQGVAGADLALTYGPAALDVLVAKRIFRQKLPAIVHHEAVEARGSVYDRLVRRLVVPAAAGVIRADQIEDGVDLTAFSPGKPGAALAGLERQRGDFVIGCISPLRAKLGLVALVRAAAAIPNAKLAVIGGGPDANALAGEARRAGLGTRLVLPGRVRDMAKAMRQFDLLAVPSGGIGRFTLLEALATGLPIVAPRGTILPSENPGYADAEGLRDALLRLAGNRELRERVGAANRETAVMRHDAKPMIARYTQIYGDAAGVDIR
ncbi:MAG TPA: glycosyltransferase family 4 protein [Sphingomonas sp.]|jgi:glycosyltransferase involved in cell wall biosynthesis|nr:glycosyltransferase family 4 protein [Sphingomonas sp.]